MKKAVTKDKSNTPSKRPKRIGEGRPTKYSVEMVKGVRKYIASCDDEVFEFWKTRGEKSDSYERKLKVKLPTMQGLALFLQVNTDTLVEWGKIHTEFSVTLKDLMALQAQRLVAGGLSGDYNPMITKLILSANHGMKERVDNTTDDKPLDAPVTINNFKSLTDDELIALTRDGKGGASK